MPSRAATSSCSRGVVTSGPTRRHTPRWSTRCPRSSAPSTELADEQDVALAGRPDLRDGARLDRPAEHEVQQRVDRRPVEVVEVDAAHPRPVPQRLEPRRHRLGCPHGGDEEDEIGVDELADQRRRRAVEQVEVVDEQHERAVAGLVEEDRAHRGDHGDEIAPLVGDPGGQQVGQRAERHLTRSFGRRGPGDVASGVVGEGQALVGQAGLAHAGRSVDHEAVGPWVGERREEQLELVVPADERPLQREHGHRRRTGTGRTRADRLGEVEQSVLGSTGSLPLSNSTRMKTPLNILDFLDRAENVYGDRIGVVDEPDQPADELGRADLARGRRATPGRWPPASTPSASGAASGSRSSRRTAPACSIALFAVSGYGRVVVPINFRLNADEVALHRRALRRVGAARRPRARRSARRRRRAAPLRARRGVRRRAAALRPRARSRGSSRRGRRSRRSTTRAARPPDRRASS